MTPCAVCERPTDATICIDCSYDIRDALNWIPRDLTDLSAVETRQASGPLALGDPRRQWDAPPAAGSLPVSPWMYAPGAADQIWVIRHTLHAWAAHIAGPSVCVIAPGRYLVAHLADVRRDPLAAQIHDELTFLHTQNDLYILGSAARTEFYGVCDRPDIRVERLVFAGPRCFGLLDCGHESCRLIRGLNVIYAPRIATCGQQLEAAPDEKTVTCQACGEQYQAAERKRAMRGKLPDSLGTFREVAGALTQVDAPVTVDMIQKAVQRGQIPGHGANADGHILVKVSDVEAYLAKRDERAAKRRKITAA